MRSLSLFCFLLVVFAQLKGIYQFNTYLDWVNIPEEHENPEAQKTGIRLFLGISYLARLASQLGIDTEPSLQRKITKLLTPKMNYEYENMVVQDEEMKGVKVRTYKPATASSKLLPALIFYHGGGYSASTIDDYDYYIYNIAKEANMIAIAIEYRLAPENPFPAPIDDCMTATQYVIDNAKALGIDKKRIVVSGDSAGGHAAAVITQKLNNNKEADQEERGSNEHGGSSEHGSSSSSNNGKNSIPKAQVLIYPFLQAFNHRLPSRTQYDFYDTEDRDTLNSIEALFWMMGITNSTKEMQDAVQLNHHTLLLKTEERIKYQSYLDVNSIPKKYKTGWDYYSTGLSMYPSPMQLLEKGHILNTDKEFAKRVQELFSLDYSPILADNKLIKKLPLTYFVVPEMDMLKDEMLIYSERLRKSGVEVVVNYYKEASHGMAPAFSMSPVAGRMFTDLVQFLKKRI